MSWGESYKKSEINWNLQWAYKVGVNCCRLYVVIWWWKRPHRIFWILSLLLVAWTLGVYIFRPFHSVGVSVSVCVIVVRAVEMQSYAVVHSILSKKENGVRNKSRFFWSLTDCLTNGQKYACLFSFSISWS